MMIYCDCAVYFDNNKFVIEDMKTKKIIFSCPKSTCDCVNEFDIIRSHRKNNP